MTFGAPEWLWGLLAIPILALIFFRSEKRSADRLREFVGPRLLPGLIGNVDRSRRVLRIGLQLAGLACALFALALPRWGYTYQDVKRKGLDLLIAVDTSRSMLSNDVQPNRLERVKLAAQDLIADLTGDRVGLIAFAGRAFVQAPLTIDYDAVVQSINELDTKTIPEGGTNISEAITLAVQTFGKSAAGNRALIIFTDGEDLSGDAVKTAKSAEENGVRIFTVGVGTPQGSLIPIPDENGGTSFVKDSSGKVVKSKLDEHRLTEIATATGGIYLHLENGPQTAKRLLSDGLAKMQAAEMDVRLSRRPIERYQWPLSAALFALVLPLLISERKRTRARSRLPQLSRLAAPAAISLVMIFNRAATAAVPGLELYDAGKFPDAYQSFEKDLQSHPKSGAQDRIQFDAGTAAYKMRDYNKALESFSGALLSKDPTLQERSHYNLGRTLEERADMGKSDEETLKDLEDAESHYEEALKLNPNDDAAKANLDEVRKKIERLKKKPTPTPTPQHSQQQKQDKNNDSDGQKKQNQSSQQNQQNQQDQQQSQSQNQNQSAQNQKSEQQQRQNQQQQQQQFAKNEPQKNQQSKPGESPSPSPGDEKQNQSPSPSQGQGQSPSPSPGNDQKENKQSSGEEQPNQPPSPSANQGEKPSPSPGEGENPSPSPGPSTAPHKPGGELKAASEGNSQNQPAQIAQGEQVPPPGQMTPREAEELLRSMKDEEARVRLDERRPRRNVYNDW